MVARGRRPADPPLRSHGGARRAAPQLLEYVGDGDNPDDPTVVDDGQAPDRPASHEIRRLPQRRLGRGAHDLLRHEIGDRVSPTNDGSVPSAEIAFGQDAHDVRPVHDDEVTQMPELHIGPRAIRRFLRSGCPHVRAHDLAEAHAHPQCTARAALPTRTRWPTSCCSYSIMSVATLATPAIWLAFAVLVVAVLAIDLGIFNRKAHVVKPGEALAWTGVWVALALGFDLFIWLRFGANAAEEFITGYAIEKALSVDNLFVMYAIFTAFSIPALYQHRVLFWGIIGAVIMRTIMVFAGVALLSSFHWLIFLFGGFLVLTGIKMLVRKDGRPRPENSRALRAIKRVIPVSNELHGGRMFVRVAGVFTATPLFLTLIAIEGADAVFAVDSIFAIFAVTTDPFIVLTSNVFAILGLRSLYFVLSGAAERFKYVQPGLALVLVFVGVKMAISDWVKIPLGASLAVIVVLVGGSVVGSLVSTGRQRRKPNHVAFRD
jgi:tellurite resistance protein TerC